MDIEDLFPRVKTHARSIPDPTARRVIVSAARAFCEATDLWKETDTFTVTDPESEAITTFPDANAYGVLAARMNGITLMPVTEAALDELEPGWAFETGVDESEPRYIIATAPDTIRLYPLGTGELQVRLLLEPKDKATTLPDWMMLHADIIAIGAAGMAMAMPGTDFFSPELAMKHEADFKHALGVLKMKAARTVVRARPRTKGRYF